MRQLLVSFLCIAAAGCCSQRAAERPAPAQTAVSPVTSSQKVAARPAPKPAESVLVSINAVDEDLREVCDDIARQAGVNIVVDPSVHEKLTLTLRDISWKEALSIVANMTRCEITVFGSGIQVVTEPPRVTIQAY